MAEVEAGLLALQNNNFTQQVSVPRVGTAPRKECLSAVSQAAALARDQEVAPPSLGAAYDSLVKAIEVSLSI